MLWVKALHIIFMVTWFAGLFTCRAFSSTTRKRATDLPSIASR